MFKYFISCILVIVLSTAHAQETCSGGVQCIVLDQCYGLHARLQQGSTPYLTDLLRTLHCGFDFDMPKICCPPEYKEIRNGAVAGGSDYGITKKFGGIKNFGGSTKIGGNNNYEGSTNSGGNLLPDERVCGIQINDRIVGGTYADLDEHPWIVLIRYDNVAVAVGWDFLCDGTLISSRYVMTAAHCVGPYMSPRWRLSQVRLGEWNTSAVRDCFQDDCSDPVVDVPVEEVIPHEGYGSNNKNQHDDIALLRLARSVQFTDFIKPICLPKTNALKQSTFVGFDAMVVGWGMTESRSVSQVKLKVQVPVVSNRECSDLFSRYRLRIINRQLCAGGEAGKDSCRGDSGGALMVRAPSSDNWIAIGVVSYGFTACGTDGVPGVYTRVGAYIDWIVSKLRP